MPLYRTEGVELCRRWAGEPGASSARHDDIGGGDVYIVQSPPVARLSVAVSGVWAVKKNSRWVIVWVCVSSLQGQKLIGVEEESEIS